MSGRRQCLGKGFAIPTLGFTNHLQVSSTKFSLSLYHDRAISRSSPLPAASVATPSSTSLLLRAQTSSSNPAFGLPANADAGLHRFLSPCIQKSARSGTADKVQYVGIIAEGSAVKQRFVWCSVFVVFMSLGG
ncbi:unnamed protein product [Cyclocybe aegerita]|uniref:Uncharacterized protein n=1 Tax=Cyclocybe aegerita TaxID=1973307 RepID=A0A8S0VQ27_CYCAE|nr:unnamed protein product [Cyclocybe aegerita]